ncbi:MAG: polysaccharide deacetylase family protein [Clostridiales bacterium]
MRIISIGRRPLKLAIVLMIVVVVLLLLWLARPNYLLSAVSSQHKLLPIYEVATNLDTVAFSFDASWGAEYTRLLLDICDQYKIKTTFLQVNIWLDEYPGLAQEIVERGHELGLHSVSHPHFSQLSDQQIIVELTENAALIEEITGFKPKLFRPPYGDYNNRVIELTNSCGYIPVQWSVDSLDWQNLTATEITARVMKKLSAGDIVLFHNNGLHTAEALPVILEQTIAKGLRVVPVSALLLTKDYYIDYNGVQRCL